MNLAPSDEQVALRDTVRRALAAEAPVAEHARPLAAGGTWAPDRAWARLAGLGALDVLVPASRGGSGLGMVEAAIVAEEMGRALHAGPWLATAVAAVRAAGAAGAPFAPGDGTAAVALPWPGHDPGFVLDAAGRVTGAQDHVLGAPPAGRLLLPAMRGREVVLVAVEGAGCAAEPGVDATTSLGRVAVDGAGCEVLGALPDGALDAVRDDVLVAWAADALGAARAVLALAVEHAKVRHQFGQPIGAFQAVQHLLVDALETVELVAGGVLHAAWAADAGDGERHLAALRLKAFAARLATVGDIAIQVLGGIGYTWEHDAHLYLRRLLGWSVAFGPASSYQVEVGRRAKMTRVSEREEA
ncbi:MAG TPA: acyl-CoA dehydrogenase family protein [Acidimicrobiales bacterium]|nr:acyl-CoA dehydrogenase family protein [Acidimicrobiales bacterium]